MNLYEIVKNACNLSSDKTLQLGRLQEAENARLNNTISYQEYDRELCKIYFACTGKSLRDKSYGIMLAKDGAWKDQPMIARVKENQPSKITTEWEEVGGKASCACPAYMVGLTLQLAEETFRQDFGKEPVYF